jgi:hypothetical protein
VEIYISESSPNGLWDGKINNEVASDGVYYYIADVTDICGTNKKFTGYFHLMK